MIDPQAGIGALAQRAAGPKQGAPMQSMERIMALAKKLSDSELAEVLSGKSMVVPQYVAMTEAMGRKQLRTAMDGARAGQQAQQPSIKDRFMQEQAQQAAPVTLPESTGIGALPAPNMQSMAGGGIVAFADEGLVQDPSMNDPMAQISGWTPEAIAADTARIQQAQTERARKEAQERLKFLQQSAPDVAAKYAQENEALLTTPTVPKAAPKAEAPPSSAPRTTPLGDKPSAPRATTPAAATAPALKPPAERPDPFAGMDMDKEQLAKDRAQATNQAQGMFLMQLGAGILSKPNLSEGIAQGINAGLPILISNQREAKKLEKEQRDYNFNLAKAREAAAQGKEEMAMKYADTASQIAYRAGDLVYKGQMAQAAMASATNRGLSKEMLNIQQATTAFNNLMKGDPRQAKELRNLGITTPQAYMNYVNTGQPPVYGELPKGASVLQLPGTE